MTLGRKLAIAATLGIAPVLVVHGLLRAQQAAELVRRDIDADHRGLAHALGLSVAAVAARSGPERARELVHDVNLRESRVLIRWIADPRTNVRRTTQRTENVGGGTDVVTRVPLQLSATERGSIELRESLAVADERVRDTVLRTATVVVLTVLICGIVLLGFGSVLVTRPMGRIIEKLRRVGEGDLGHPLVLRQNDEIGTLATAVNEMCNQLGSTRERAARETARRISALEQLRHADRLSTVGQLASGIAHELGTPLQVTSVCAASIASGESTADEARRDAKLIRDQADRMTNILRQLLDFARPRTPAKHSEDLFALARSTVGFLEPLAARRGIGITVDGGAGLVAAVDAGQIQQVLTNLVMNAIHAVPSGGHIEVRLASTADGHVEMCVEDDGPGLAPDVLEHVFEPFFSTKEPGEGTGLGLSVAYGIVAEHRGRIRAEMAPLGGARFVVELPRGDA